MYGFYELRHVISRYFVGVSLFDCGEHFLRCFCEMLFLPRLLHNLPMVLLDSLQFFYQHLQLFLLSFERGGVRWEKLAFDHPSDCRKGGAPQLALHADVVAVAVELLCLAGEGRLRAAVRHAEEFGGVLRYGADWRAVCDHFKINNVFSEMWAFNLYCTFYIQ